MMMQFKKVRSRKQGGFTLIEMMGVIAAIGLVMAIIGPKIVGALSGGSAKLMERAARSAQSNYEMINMSCGTSMSIARNNVIESQDNAGVAELLFYGNLDDTYSSCYERSGVQPSTGDVSVRDGEGSFGTDFFLNGTEFEIQFEDQVRTATDARALMVRYHNVDDVTAETAAQRFDESWVIGDGAMNLPSDAEGRAPMEISGSANDWVVSYRFPW
jgi:prepilin-type N-terminal cleavage/methylation domain-containing protein